MDSWPEQAITFLTPNPSLPYIYLATLGNDHGETITTATEQKSKAMKKEFIIKGKKLTVTDSDVTDFERLEKDHTPEELGNMNLQEFLIALNEATEAEHRETGDAQTGQRAPEES